MVLHVLPSYYPEQILDARGSQNPPGDSPVGVFYKPWVAEERMHSRQHTSPSNNIHSQTTWGKWGVAIRVRHWDLLSVKGYRNKDW